MVKHKILNVEEDTEKFENILLGYKRLVDNADINNQDFFINNSTIEHATFLTYKLLKRAKSSIKIFAGDLSELYYDNSLIITTIKNKLEEGINMQIILEQKFKPKQFNEFLKNEKVYFII